MIMTWKSTFGVKRNVRSHIGALAVQGWLLANCLGFKFGVQVDLKAMKMDAVTGGMSIDREAK